MIDAAWSAMRADQFARSKSGANNYTVVDLQRAMVGYDSIANEIFSDSFKGVTGTVHMPWRDRLRTWDIIVHKRVSNDCNEKLDGCDPFVMMLKNATTGEIEE